MLIFLTVKQGIYDIMCDPKFSQFQILPMPFDATTSYKSGASLGPEAIFLASKQVDLLDSDVGSPIYAGIYFNKTPYGILHRNNESIKLVKKIRKSFNEIDLKSLQRYTQKNNTLTYNWSMKILNKKQIPIILGGDHSTPLGSIMACSEHYKNNMGILQIDAHADLRNSYEGFHDSHASIMYNVLTKIPKLERIVQIGVRDFCEEEALFIEFNKKKIKTFFDSDLRRARIGGKIIPFFKNILKLLPNFVYLTVDIDGLDPSLCPNTGTPVPGGLRFDEFITLLEVLVTLKKRIIGMDLVEVAIPREIPRYKWAEILDANIGARILYKMIGFALKTQS